ncbi:MAG: ABC transporter ATP-binding protein [Solirubrobacterales bacterium]|nr:ABC transporter ATP-binding protein [Solirubrobacterales bacterium]
MHQSSATSRVNDRLLGPAWARGARDEPLTASNASTTDDRQPADERRQQAADLELCEISKLYPGQSDPAIDKLSLKVEAGEICVLVGPSGCGKTTAMRLVNRMIEPTDGDILIDGESIRDRGPAELRRHIGYAIQRTGLFPHLTIADNISTVPRLLGWDKQRIDARVDELLELVSLDADDMRDRYPGQLSGGQQQRVGVARALAADPPLLLMDEPFGADDPINRERLQNEFLRLQGQLRKTIVFVTHDIDEAIKMGDRIAVLKKGGKLAQYASPAELLTNPADKFVEDFVGADRSLKRLALQRVRDIDLWKVAEAREGERSEDVRRKFEDSDLPFAILLDEQRRPLGWLSDEAVRGERVTNDTRSPATPHIDLDDILRDALAELLSNGVQYAPVLDSRGAVSGVLSLEVIGRFLHSAPTESRTGAELVMDDPEPIPGEGDETPENTGK